MRCAVCNRTERDDVTEELLWGRVRQASLVGDEWLTTQELVFCPTCYAIALAVGRKVFCEVQARIKKSSPG